MSKKTPPKPRRPRPPDEQTADDWFDPLPDPHDDRGRRAGLGGANEEDPEEGDFDEEYDDEALEDLLEDAPALRLVGPFARAATRARWFTRLGEAPSEAVAGLSRVYLDGLGFPDVSLAIVPDWEEAAAAAESLDWDTAAWSAEEGLRADLTVRAVEAIGEEAFEVAVAHVNAATSDIIQSAVEDALALWDLQNDELARLAAGSGVQACHLALLSLLVGEAGESDPLTAKYRLFEVGRWPIGVAGLSLNLF